MERFHFQSFFDTLDHQICRDLLSKRVSDGVILRLIGKWVNAGVLDGGVVRRSEAGTLQGTCLRGPAC